MIGMTPRTLREIRESRGLTRTELGALIGMSAEAIRNYEMGYRRPNPSVALRVAKALGITVEDLYHSLGITLDTPPPARPHARRG